MAGHFAQVYSRKNKRLVTGLAEEGADCLLRYDWPGNVRELENAIEHAIVFGSTREILLEDFPEHLLDFGDGGPGVPAKFHDAVREAKHGIVITAMRSASGDYGQARPAVGHSSQ